MQLCPFFEHKNQCAKNNRKDARHQVGQTDVIAN